MHEKKRQLWAAYGQSLLIAFCISLGAMPFLMLGQNRPPIQIALLVFIVSGFVFGTAFFLLSAVREQIRIPSFLLNVIAQTAFVCLTVAVASAIVMWAVFAIVERRGPFEEPLLHDILHEISLLPVVLFLISGVLLAFIINAVFQVSRKLGPGVLWNWITGKYYKPREEERIFMFLDIRDSTSVAERLGNLLFSELVRDFFQDMTYPVLETRGEVSHFIGDEAVLTWRPKKGFANSNCVAMFFRMRETIQARSSYYSEKYGLVPEFKAGLHFGAVVVTEVGEIKSEIVFHGDVLNTAARLQTLCKDVGKELLISGEVRTRLPGNCPYGIEPLGDRRLKGKEAMVSVYSVRE